MKPMAKADTNRLLQEPCCTLDITGMDEQRLVRLFKATGNPTRFAILKYLVTHSGCITGDIVEALPIAQATVSQHLKVLVEAGWTVSNPEGNATCHHLNEHTVRWFRETIGKVF